MHTAPDTPAPSFHASLNRAQLLPSLRLGLWALAAFALALWLTRAFALPLQAVLAAHASWGVGVFVASAAVAVLLPLLTNLPLVPLAVLAWGPAWTVLLLLLGWVAGAAAAFALGRTAGPMVLRRFPLVARHADIDRLIHPQHRLGSLILLRMTFPVDVLSYALGLFSRNTTLVDNVLSTALGAAPFAVMFAYYPAMPACLQLALLGLSLLAFAVYLVWLFSRDAGPAGR
jgi:uncharacterized membrane protein YdjX (TVP38/TMEM64 family)